MDRIEIQIIQSLLNGENDYYRILSLQDSSIKEFIEKIEEMKKNGILEQKDDRLLLTKYGEKFAKNFFGVEVNCKVCKGTGIIVDNFYKNVLSKFKKIVKNRPKAIEIYDQGFMNVEDVIKRVEFIHERGEIYGKIFVVGDDDLLSIVLSLTGFPEKVVVIDADERIIDFINSLSKKYSLNVEALVCDVQKELPKELKRKFDVFVSDPVETLAGIKLFLSRGVSALKGVGCSGYFGLTTLEASRKKWFEIEKILLEMGFVITDIKRRFSVYPESNLPIQTNTPLFRHLQFYPKNDWYCSSFLRIEAVKDVKPVIEGEMIINEKVYADEETLATPF